MGISHEENKMKEFMTTTPAPQTILETIPWSKEKTYQRGYGKE